MTTLKNLTEGIVPTIKEITPAVQKPSPEQTERRDIAGMIFVEGGTFQIRSNDKGDHEKPIHPVEVNSFNIAEYQVTQAEWWDLMGNYPSQFKGDNLPVESMSWYDAVEFCN